MAVHGRAWLVAHLDPGGLCSQAHRIKVGHMASLTSRMLAEITSVTSRLGSKMSCGTFHTLYSSDKHMEDLQKSPRPKRTMGRRLYGSEPPPGTQKENPLP